MTELTPVYVLALSFVEDIDSAKHYIAESKNTTEKFNATTLCKTGNLTFLSNELPINFNRVLIMKFNSTNEAHAWFQSDEYQQIRKHKPNNMHVTQLIIPEELNNVSLSDP